MGDQLCKDGDAAVLVHGLLPDVDHRRAVAMLQGDEHGEVAIQRYHNPVLGRGQNEQVRIRGHTQATFRYVDDVPAPLAQDPRRTHREALIQQQGDHAARSPRSGTTARTSIISAANRNTSGRSSFSRSG